MSESSNSSSTNSWQQDNRRVIGEGGISAEGSIVNYTTNTLDGGAFNFGGKVLDANGEALNGAFGFGGKALQFAGNVADSAMGLAGQSAGFVTQTARDAMDNNLQILGAAFGANDAAYSKAYDSLANSSNMVATAYADAKGRGALTDKMIMLAVVAMAAVAMYAGQK